MYVCMHVYMYACMYVCILSREPLIRPQSGSRPNGPN